MSAQSIRAPGAQRLAVASAAAALAVLTLAALRYGPAALGLPLAAVAALALLQRARLTVALVIGLMVLVEGSTDAFLGYRGLYNPIRFGVTPMECLLSLAILAVVLERMRAGRPLRLAGPLTVPLILVVLARRRVARPGRSRASACTTCCSRPASSSGCRSSRCSW